MTTLMQINETRGLVLAIGILVVLPSILAWGWIKLGVTPMDVARELMGR